MKKIKDISVADRPREKFRLKGERMLSNQDLLAIILGSGSSKNDVRTIAYKIDNEFATNLLHISVADLKKIDGIGEKQAMRIISARELFKRLFDLEHKYLIKLDTAEKAYAQVYEYAVKNKEYLVGLFLDARYNLLHKEVISVGILDSNLTHPREIFWPAIKYSAAKIVLVHNHPSGGLEPSAADVEITDRLLDAARIMGIEIIDHLIISKNGFRSILTI